MTMTEQAEAQSMEAGRELDALAATRVMGWSAWRSPVVPRNDLRPDCWLMDSPTSPTLRMIGWKPSSDIADAWIVLDEMRLKGWWPYISHNGEVWVCELRDQARPFDAQGVWFGVGDLPAEAICRAALLAIESQTDSLTQGSD